MRNLKLSSCVVALAGLLLTAPLATAQSAANDASTAERPTLWAGLGLETIVPFGSLGVSAPVGRVGTLTVAPRLGVDALLVLGPVVSADVLFSGADVGFYGGPSAGLFLAGQRGWRAGLVGGYRSRTRPDLGFFVEGGLRYTVLRDAFTGFVAPPPGQPSEPPRDVTLMSPSLHLGVTYRF